MHHPVLSSVIYMGMYLLKPPSLSSVIPVPISRITALRFHSFFFPLLLSYYPLEFSNSPYWNPRFNLIHAGDSMLRRTWATVIGEQELRESLYVCLKLLTCQKNGMGKILA
jgi:hypothetical protein